MSITPEEVLSNAVVDWCTRLGGRQRNPRHNVRLLFGDPALARRVRERLEPQSGQPAWYIVRTSADEDAVRLRHGRPHGAPDGVQPGTPLLYVLFWTPSERNHAQNAQSLADLKGVGVTDFLADAEGFVVAEEREMLDRCAEAARAWADPGRATEHLTDAWNALRHCLREQRGGRDRSLPFVTEPGDYARFLVECRIPDETWKAIPAAGRAAQLVAQWGHALASLSMFHVPALASVLGMTTDAGQLPPRRRHFDRFLRALQDMLSDNLDAALDHAHLAEVIAGKESLESRVEKLAGQVPLHQDRPGDASRALIRFCHEGDPAAFRAVEWLFRRDASNRRSESHGLKGLLIARRTHRARVNPLDNAGDTTNALLLERAGPDATFRQQLEDYADLLKGTVQSDPRRAAEAADAVQALGRNEVPEQMALPAPVRAALEALVCLPAGNANRWERAAKLWRDLGPDDVEHVRAPNLLLGLLRLALRHLESGATDRVFAGGPPKPGELLVVWLVEKGQKKVEPLKLPLGPWGDATLEEMRCWLGRVVMKADEDVDDGDLQDDETEARTLTFEVGRGSGASPRSLGTIVVPLVRQFLWKQTLTDAPRAWKLDEPRRHGAVSWGAELAALFDEACNELQADYPSALAKLWEQLARDLLESAVPEQTAMIAPLPARARAFVDRWSEALGRVGEPTPQERALEAMKRFEALQAEGRMAEATEAMDEMRRLMIAGPQASPPSLEEIRALLRAFTGEVLSSTSEGDAHVRLYLTPFHPLVLRLRLLQEQLLLGTLAAVFFEGWPAAARDVLEETSRTWGFPEPVHAYGWWDGDPLVFDAWTGDGSCAAFSFIGAPAAVEMATLGTGRVTDVVRRYVELAPASGDRLRLRIVGDAGASWAANCLKELVDLPAIRGVDIDVVTDRPSREFSGIEAFVHEGSARRRLFEMSDDGALPRFRVRRVRQATEPVHVALVLGPAARTFSPGVDRTPSPPPTHRDPWNTALLFDTPQPRLVGNALVVGLPHDPLSERVARAVAFASKNSKEVFVERLTFDASSVRGPIRDLHAGAHWMVIASRQPVHRAIQAVGDDVAVLLDFRGGIERGRPIHICTSVGRDQFEHDLARLESMLTLILGAEPPGRARALIEVARRFAPGLAIGCAGAVTPISVQGLLGLLLTQKRLSLGGPGTLVLALDQHQQLLGRASSGQRSDALTITDEGESLIISVAEAKFTGAAVHDECPVISQARQQVATTVDRLAHLGVEHPLAICNRTALATAVRHQLQLACRPHDEVDAFVERVRAPSTRIAVAPAPEGEVHVWSTHPETTAGELTGSGVARTFIHGLNATRAMLVQLLDLDAVH